VVVVANNVGKNVCANPVEERIEHTAFGLPPKK
jgi:hypothetical protein